MNEPWKNARLRRIRIVAAAMCIMLLGSLFPSIGVSAAPDETTTPSNLPIAELENKVDAYVEKYIGTSVPGAAVVVVKDGEIVLSKGYGYSDVASKSEISSADSVFEYAGLTKVYTWTAVMQLVEQGTLDLNADIMTYLPEEFGAKLKKHLAFDTPITLVHLMNNTAGFEEKEFDSNYYNATYLSKNLEEALLETMPEQVFEPGEVMTGSSFSASLAGYIVESVTGKEFYDYVEETILTPLAVTNTTAKPNFANNAQIIANKVKAYTNFDNEFEEMSYTYSNLYATSGMNGTAEALAKLVLSFMPEEGKDGKLLSNESIKTMLTKTYSVNASAKGQVHGLYEYPAEIEAYYHDGSNLGFSNMMTFVPDESFGVIILSNTSNATDFLYGLTDYLILQDSEGAVTPSADLPSVDPIVETEFIGAKRSHSDMLEIFGYFMNCPRFEKIDDTTIALNGQNYTQVEPYVFKYVGETDSPLYRSIASTIYFGHTEDGKITKWSYGAAGSTEYVNMDTATKDQKFVSLTFLALMVIGFSAAVLFTYQVVTFILDIMHRRLDLKDFKNAYRYFSIIFIGIAINVISMLMRMMSHTNLASRDFKWNVYINIVLAILGVVSLANLARKTKGQKFKPYKIVLASFMIMCFVILIYLMFAWKFFVLL